MSGTNQNKQETDGKVDNEAEGETDITSNKLGTSFDDTTIKGLG